MQTALTIYLKRYDMIYRQQYNITKNIRANKETTMKFMKKNKRKRERKGTACYAYIL